MSIYCALCDRYAGNGREYCSWCTEEQTRLRRWRQDWSAAWAGIGWLASVEAAINVTGGLLNALAARHEQLVVAVTNMGVDVKKLTRDAKRKGNR